MSEHLSHLRDLYLGAATNQPYHDLTLTMGGGTATVTCTAHGGMHHAAGAVHGAHLFKLLDDAAFFAANSMVPEHFVLTVQFSTQLMRPVVQGTLRAEGRVTKPGRTTFFAESEVFGPDGKLVARGQGTFAVSSIELAKLEPMHDPTSS